ncbi:MAG: O-antigen ligase family protein [Acidobacteria bacterium]|nr:O-antigen ligase family protein [Acidobacteriota bacterium]
MVQAGVVAIIAWGALAFGAVYAWAYVPLLIACAAIGVLGLASRAGPPMSRSNRAALLALLAVIGAVLVQLLPMPAGMLKTISPSADSFLRQHDLAYSLNAGRHSLSINPAATALGLSFLVVLVVFLAGMLRAFSRIGVRRIVFAIVAFGVVLAFIGIIQKAILGDHTYMGMKIYGFWVPESKLVVPFGPFVNRNHFAGWMVMAIPLAIAWLCALWQEGRREERRDWRGRLLWFSSPAGGQSILIGFAVLIMTLSLAMSMSRSGMASLALTTIVLGVLLIKALPERRTRIAAAALFALLVAVPVLWVGLGDAVKRFSSDSVGSVQMRIRAWGDTDRLIRDFPVTGSGLNTFGTAMLLYQSGAGDLHFQEAHNDYLQIAAEGGVLVGLPAVIAFVLVVRAIRRRFTAAQDDPWGHWIRVGATMGLIAIALQSLVEFSLQMPGNAAFFTVLLAVAMHQTAGAEAAHRRAPIPARDRQDDRRRTSARSR